MDNLESGTYEVFEKDPIKYAEYQAAIESALKDIGSEKEARNEKVPMYVQIMIQSKYDTLYVAY